MKLLNVVSEIVINYKDTYGVGLEHNIFSSNSNPDILYKVGSPNLLNYWVPLFKKHPHLFVHVYGGIKHAKFPVKREHGEVNKVDAAYVVVEKLDTKSFTNFYSKMLRGSGRAKDFEILLLEWAANEDEKSFPSLYPEIDSNIKKNIPDLYGKYIEFLDLVKKIVKIVGEEFDVHSGQFGFDKKGMIKCLDI